MSAPHHSSEASQNISSLTPNEAFVRQIVITVSVLFSLLFGLIMLAHFSELPALNRMRVLNPSAGAVPFIGSLLLLIATLRASSVVEPLS